MVHAPNTRKGQRFAVVVSKKVLKSAVGRNRIRRRVYESIRLNQPETHADYIFIIHDKSVADLPFLELQDIIVTLIGKA